MSTIDLRPFQEQLLNSPHLYITKRNLSGKCTYANPAFSKKFEPLNHTISFTGCQDYQMDSSIFDQIRHQLTANPAEVIVIEGREQTEAAHTWWVHWDFSAIKDEQGNIAEILGVGYDMTESYLAKLRLEEAAHRVNAILDSVTDGFYAVNEDWTIAKVNKITENTVSLQASQLVGKNLWDVFPSDEQFSYPNVFKKAMKEKDTLRFEEFFDGKWFANTVYPYADGIAVFFQDITEQKRIEAEIKAKENKLKESIQKLKAISDSSSDTYVLIGWNYQILSFNQTAQKEFYNFHQKHLQEGEDFYQYVIKGTEESFENHFYKALEGETTREEILLIPFPDGTKQWRQVRYFPAYDVDNQIFAVSFNSVNISKLKLEEDKARQSQVRLRAILDSTSDTYILLGKQYEILSFNQTAQARFQDYSAEQLKDGDNYLQHIISKDIRERFKNNFAKVLAGETINIETLLPLLDGTKEWRQIRYFPVYDEVNEVFAVSFNSIDINAVKQQEEKVRQTSRRLKAILDSTTDLYILIGRNYEILSFNQAANDEFYNFHKKHLKEGDSFLQYGISHTEDSFENEFERVLAGEILKAEVFVSFLDGKQEWRQIRYFPVYDEANEVFAVSFNAVDIHEAKQQEEKVRQTQITLKATLNDYYDAEQKIIIRNKLLERIAFIHSHELRRPVANILSLIDLIKEEEPCEEELKMYINYLQTSAHDLDKVIHNIVDKTHFHDID